MRKRLTKESRTDVDGVVEEGEKSVSDVSNPLLQQNTALMKPADKKRPLTKKERNILKNEQKRLRLIQEKESAEVGLALVQSLK